MKKNHLTGIAAGALAAIVAIPTTAFAASAVQQNTAASSSIVATDSEYDADDSSIVDGDYIDYAVYADDTDVNGIESYEENDPESYIASLTYLTDDERTKMLEAYGKVDKLYEEIDKLFDNNGDLGNNEAKYNELDTQISNILNGVSDIQEKIIAHEQQEYIDSLTMLTDEEKTKLNDAYAQQHDLFKQIDAYLELDMNADEKAAADALMEKVHAIDASILELEGKIRDADIKASTEITEEEKATLISTYRKIDKLSCDMNALLDGSCNIKSGSEDEYAKLEAEQNALSDSIESLSNKVYVCCAG